ncbi:MAG TPA: FkbM family methyltransferase [Gaiellaceae bacterium]|nr:FkbM family methyltransferase [Gaiellaceae bacterium]
MWAMRAAVGRALRWLDRPGARSVYALAASIRETVHSKSPRWLVYRDGLWLHHTRRGVLPWPTTYLAPTLEEWDAQTLDQFCWEYVPGPGDVVVDVGAGIGSEVPTWVRRVGASGRVIAVEAHPGSFARLRALVEANHYRQVTLVHAAISAAGGTVRVTDRPNADLNTIVAADEGAPVPARTLDDVLAALGVDHVDLLKMNIEGAERLAVRGMSESIRRIRHAVVCCHDFLADRGGGDELRTRNDVRRFLAGSGFVVRERRDDPRYWIPDYLYAVRSHA